MTLEDFRLQSELSLTELSALLNKPVTTVHGWCSKRRKPMAKDLATIETVTNGRVTARDFMGLAA